MALLSCISWSMILSHKKKSMQIILICYVAWSFNYKKKMPRFVIQGRVICLTFEMLKSVSSNEVIGYESFIQICISPNVLFYFLFCCQILTQVLTQLNFFISLLSSVRNILYENLPLKLPFSSKRKKVQKILH